MKASIREKLQDAGFDTSERAKKAAEARWERHNELHSIIDFDWQNGPLEAAKEHLAKLLSTYNLGVRIVNQRVGQEERKATVCCEFCQRKMDQKKAVFIKPVRDEGTKLFSNKFWCSAQCVTRSNQLAAQIR